MRDLSGEAIGQMPALNVSEYVIAGLAPAILPAGTLRYVALQLLYGRLRQRCDASHAPSLFIRLDAWLRGELSLPFLRLQNLSNADVGFP